MNAPIEAILRAASAVSSLRRAGDHDYDAARDQLMGSDSELLRTFAKAACTHPDETYTSGANSDEGHACCNLCGKEWPAGEERAPRLPEPVDDPRCRTCDHLQSGHATYGDGEYLVRGICRLSNCLCSRFEKEVDQQFKVIEAESIAGDAAEEAETEEVPF